jgi:hypothetical protein
VSEWLEEYCEKNKIPHSCCINCYKQIDIPVYFCLEPRIKLNRDWARWSKCAYEFFLKHPEKVVEWITE